MPAAMPPKRELQVFPRRAPTTGMMAFAGGVFAFASLCAMARAVVSAEWLNVILMSIAVGVAGYFAWYGIDACLQGLRVTVSAGDEVTLAWLGTKRVVSFPLALLTGVRVETHSAATARIVIELEAPNAPIALDALAVPDDVRPLATKLRSFLMSG